MSFSDVLKQYLIEGNLSALEMNMQTVLASLVIACCIGLYIFIVYGVTNRNSLYNVNFNIALVAMTIITAGIILTMQSSLVVSLGMVGALSIIRFRTPIKDALDLVYLFWAVGIGIMCGAMQFEIAIMVSLGLTIVVLGLQILPRKSETKILILRSATPELVEQYIKTIKKATKYSKVKVQNVRNTGLELIVECRVRKGAAFVEVMRAMEGVNFVSLMSHDGDMVY
jgi:uncharacterized membrane protein YhiD involved in acid resistance